MKRFRKHKSGFVKHIVGDGIMDRKVGLALPIVLILALSSFIAIGASVTSIAPIIFNIPANDLPALDAQTVVTWSRGGAAGHNTEPPPGPTDPTAIIVNPFQFEFPNTKLITQINNALVSKGYGVALYQNTAVTVAWLRTGLTSMQAIFWRGHGGWFGPPYNGVVLATGEKANVRGRILYLPNQAYYNDYVNYRIAVGYVSGVGYFYCITPKFITYYYGTSLTSSLVYVEACYSLYDSSMASTFTTSSGPGAYIGWSYSVTVSYGDSTAGNCFKQFAADLSVSTVITGYKDPYTGATLLYYGNGSLTL
jgi:hypothetical protein